MMVEGRTRDRSVRGIASALLLPALVLLPALRPAASPEARASARELKKLSLEELMDIEVTLVSRHEEPLAEAASAIQVITREDIRRSGVATLPEAMRLASNLQVAQLTAGTYAISARGINSTNNTLPNKLLVMIDGRTVYTPLYSGVFWDAQNIVLDNVDRIEIISGPAGSVWGSNAVNGIINIVTLPAGETQGVYVEGAAGTYLRDAAAARYGGRLGRDVAYRVFGQRIDQGPSRVADSGRDAEDDWDFTRGGARVDWTPGERDRVFVHAEASVSRTDQALPGPGDVDYEAHFVQARWNRALTPAAELVVKAYFDRTFRDIPATLREDLKTWDVDAYHAFSPFAGNRLMWGLGYRLQRDEVDNTDTALTAVHVIPANKDLRLFSAFVQDQQDLFGGRLRLTLGTRLEHNVYSGWEAMPTGRAALSYAPRQTLWAAVSRAVRSPGRLDVEAFTPPPSRLPPGAPGLKGGPDFESEILHAYELGWRVGMGERASLSLAGFVHSYEDLRIVAFTDSATLHFVNGLQGEIYGLELHGDLQALESWRLRGGVTVLRRDFYPSGDFVELPQPGNVGNDPAWHASVQSWLDLPRGFELNGTARWVDDLPAPAVPGYFTCDLGVGWRWRGLEAAVYGRNLIEDEHMEARVSDALPAQAIPRSVTARVAWRW